MGHFRICSILVLYSVLQHASQDVDKMILGNKCDMNDKRVVSKEKGEAVSTILTESGGGSKYDTPRISKYHTRRIRVFRRRGG